MSNLNKAKESLAWLSRDEIRSLIGATQKAMEYVETLTRSELPPGSPKSRCWNANDLENSAAWKKELRVYRNLLRKLWRLDRQHFRSRERGQGNEICVR